MTAHRLGLSAWLLARLQSIFAIARAMAVLLARMRATLKRFATDTATPRICQPTGYVLQYLFSTQAHLLG